uniref:Uncharacterized protein n=1 Tax=viral metagenome TaxID=1070528 RepID=A0A6C0JC88_9ZZZZ
MNDSFNFTLNSNIIFSPRFQPQTHKFDYLYIHKNEVINNHINDLLNLYNKLDFQNINIRLKMYDIQDVAFIYNENDYKVIQDYFRKLLLIKNHIKKYKNKIHASKRDWVYTNNKDLSLNLFDNNPNILRLKDYVNKTIYTFTVNEVNNIFKFSIYESFPEYSYPYPQNPRNPYTNNEFTLKDKILMYDFLLKRFTGLGKSLPEYIIVYKNSYFSIDNLKKRYNNSLFYHSTCTYVTNLSDEVWKINMRTLLRNTSYLNKNICFKCILENKDRFNLFYKVLVLCELNNNNIYEYGDYQSVLIDICQKHNLFTDNFHYLKHRRILRGRRSAHNLPLNISNQPVQPIRVNIPPLNLNDINNHRTMELEIADVVDHFVTQVLDNVVNNQENNT